MGLMLKEDAPPWQSRRELLRAEPALGASSAYDSLKDSTVRTSAQELDMADRDPWQNLTRYSIAAVIVIIVLWIIYALTGGESTPKPSPTGDTTAAPAAKP